MMDAVKMMDVSRLGVIEVRLEEIEHALDLIISSSIDEPVAKFALKGIQTELSDRRLWLEMIKNHIKEGE